MNRRDGPEPAGFAMPVALHLTPNAGETHSDDDTVGADSEPPSRHRSPSCSSSTRTRLLMYAGEAPRSCTAAAKLDLSATAEISPERG